MIRADMRLPDWVGAAELNRPDARTINKATNTDPTTLYSGWNETVPVVYGEMRVTGPIIAGPFADGSTIRYAVAVCYAGENGIGGFVSASFGGEPPRSIPAISNPNAGASAASGTSGATITVFDGRQTAPSALLTAIQPGFADVFAGVAYAVVSVSSSQAQGSNLEVEFTLRGRRCLDPRSNEVAYTENPALQLHDFVTNTEFGMGKRIVGLPAVADLCDSLYGGLPRCRSGLVFQDPLPEAEALALLCQYAECLYGYAGGDIVVLPDSVVPDAGIQILPADQIINGTLALGGVDQNNLPTSVSIMFTDRADPTAWASRPATASLPIEQLRDVPPAFSSIEMPGVYRRLEADRRAWQRLMRLRLPGRVEFQMLDTGVLYQAGDVVRLPDLRGMQALDVRIMAQPEMTSPGKYKVVGEVYSSATYPGGQGLGTALPVGAIFPFRGSVLPAGCAWWDAANGRLLKGTNGGSTDGAGTLVSGASGSTDTQPNHTGSQRRIGPKPRSFGEGRVSLDREFGIFSDSQIRAAGEHAHSVNVPAVSADSLVPRQMLRFARVITDPILLPADAGVLAAVAQYEADRVSASLDAVGRLLGAGSAPQFYPATTARAEPNTSTAGAHSHYPATGNVYDEVAADPDAPFPGNEFWMDTNTQAQSGVHFHTVLSSLRAQAKAKALPLYYAAEEVSVKTGAVVLFEGSDIPEGWAVCDGENGTIDLRGYFVQISVPADAGKVVSEVSTATRTIYFSSNPGHTHYRESRSYGMVKVTDQYSPVHSETQGAHTHESIVSFDGPVDFTHRTIKYLQYLGD